MTTTSNTTGAIREAAGRASMQKRDAGSTMRGYIAKMHDEIAKALPSVITPERFTRIVTTALSTNPKLAETTPASFLGAMMTAAQLGVEPNTPLGQAYLLPYKNKGQLECQFQLGYKGLIDLAYRSGQISVVQAHAVHENDEFTCEYGLEPTLHHKPAIRNRGEVYAYYAVFKTKDGGFGYEVMTREDIQAHAAKYSQSYGSGYSPWATNFDEMAKKTVLKRVLKYAPLKSDFVRNMETDGTIKHELSDDMATVQPVAVDYVVDTTTGEIMSEPENKE